jgi:hypothetical protein
LQPSSWRDLSFLQGAPKAQEAMGLVAESQETRGNLVCFFFGTVYGTEEILGEKYCERADNTYEAPIGYSGEHYSKEEIIQHCINQGGTLKQSKIMLIKSTRLNSRWQNLTVKFLMKKKQLCLSTAEKKLFQKKGIR